MRINRRGFAYDKDIDISHAPNPHAMIMRLLPIISADDKLASYVNYHFGTKVKASRVAEIRHDREHQKRCDAGYSDLHNAAPIPVTPNEKRLATSASTGSAALLKALRKFHPAQCGEARAA